MKYKKKIYKRGDAQTRPQRSRGPRAVLLCALGALLLAGAALALFLPGGLLSSPLTRRDTVLTVGGRAIESDEYIYCLLEEKAQREALDASYFENKENETAFFADAERLLVRRCAALQWAQELGITADADTAAAVETHVAGARASYDSDESFRAALAEKGLTEALYRRVLEDELLLDALAAQVYSDEALTAVTDEQALAFAAQKGAYAFKCILITAGGDEAAAEKEALAQSLSAALQAQPERFDEYAALYNEDPLAAHYPDGFNMLPGELSAELEAAVAALGDGAVSDAVAAQSGWFILTRCALSPDAFRSGVLDARIEDKLEEYAAALPVCYGRGYHNMKAEQLVFAGEAKAQ